jgi:hypothetical protein
VGTPAPAGDGDVGGGTSEGGGEAGQEEDGENIADDPDYVNPTANSGTGLIANNEDAYVSDGNSATSDFYASNDFSGFGYGIPSGNQITGIELKIDVRDDGGGNEISLSLSWDGGSTFTSSKSVNPVDSTDAVYVFGGPSDLWGRSWSPDEFSDGNLVLRLTFGGNTFYVDGIVFRVYHQATGGSSGGGGAI